MSRCGALLGLFLSTSALIGCGVTPDADGACPGSFEIKSGYDIGNLNACKSVDGDVRVLSSSFDNVDGFEHLEAITGELRIFANPALKNVDGFSALQSVGALFVYANDALENVDGLRRIGGGVLTLDVEGNAELKSIAGLSGLTGANDVLIAHNPELPQAQVDELLRAFDTSCDCCGNRDGPACSSQDDF